MNEATYMYGGERVKRTGRSDAGKGRREETTREKSFLIKSTTPAILHVTSPFVLPSIRYLSFFSLLA